MANLLTSLCAFSRALSSFQPPCNLFSSFSVNLGYSSTCNCLQAPSISINHAPPPWSACLLSVLTPGSQTPPSTHLLELRKKLHRHPGLLPLPPWRSVNHLLSKPIFSSFQQIHSFPDSISPLEHFLCTCVVFPVYHVLHYLIILSQ